MRGIGDSESSFRNYCSHKYAPYVYRYLYFMLTYIILPFINFPSMFHLTSVESTIYSYNWKASSVPRILLRKKIFLIDWLLISRFCYKMIIFQLLLYLRKIWFIANNITIIQEGGSFDASRIDGRDTFIFLPCAQK